MAISRKEEARALSADEKELVEKSHHPAVQELSDADLSGLVKLLRERRDKAQTEAHRRRREIRGKGAPKRAAASKADSGSQVKLAVLAMAMRRLNVHEIRFCCSRPELAQLAPQPFHDLGLPGLPGRILLHAFDSMRSALD